jgi:hypothetical protein
MPVMRGGTSGMPPRIHIVCASRPIMLQRIATGETVEPVPPWIFKGCMTKANS